MPRQFRTSRWLLVLALLPLATAGAGQRVKDSRPERLSSFIPLGAESFSIEKPWKGTLTLLGSVENPQFGGWMLVQEGRRRALRTEAGEPVRFYPDEVDFRITASLREKLIEPSPVPLTASAGRNDYLLGLRFRVAIFRGLHKRTLPPAAVDLIGVPADLQSEERVFRVSVRLPHVPLQDRVVLEVLSPRGERIAKFHLDLI